MEINRASAAYQAPPPVVRETTSRDLPATPAPIGIQAHSASGLRPAAPTPDGQLEDAVKAANEFLAPVTNAIAFSIDTDSGKTIVKLVDNQTNEVIRQFPSKQMLAIAKDLTQHRGLLISEKS